MFIKELNIKGFRSLKDVTFKPGKLNVLIGPNGSGKSNLMRFLELISASADRRLGKFIQKSGGMESVLWDGKSENIFLRLDFVDESLNFNETTNSIYRYENVIERIGKSSSYKVQSEELNNCDYNKRFFTRRFKTVQMNENDLTLTVFPEEEITEDETFLGYCDRFAGTKFISKIQKSISKINIYHDIDFGPNSQIRQSTIARYEKTIDSDGQNFIPVLHTLYTDPKDKDFRISIDKAMRAAFGNEYEELTFPPAADQRIQMRLRWRSLSKAQSAADLSDGTLNFLFLITLLLNPEAPSILAIDEPENGLHPSMMPIIAELAGELSETTQIIFTTHSQQFLDAFADEPPTTIVVNCVKGETSLKTLDGPKLKKWLREYSLGSLYSTGELEAMD